MKKLIFIALTALLSSSAMAEGTSIDKSTVINATENLLTNTQAIGENSSAQTGSVTMQGAKVSKSTVINASENLLTNTQAIGKNSSASTGSVDLK